ncbi:MAG: Formamidopyrimidine-DNA glycosylase [Betaproteobacteria bacterium]|nr:Formamidopyrimidine-DNA glycosylase [Betaproteobacteria bacterium]
MPELPEVETTRRGLAPHICGSKVVSVVVRNRAMREPVPRNLASVLTGRRIDALERRAKYLLFRAGDGTLIVHLGMSGRLWLVDAATAPGTHDHFDLALANGSIVRLRDPRRFGLVLWQRGDPLKHKLLRDIGPEPLSPALNAQHLYAETRARSGAIKSALMDSHLVAGVGNIYANEALFRARINPKLPARRIGLARYGVLVEKIREVLGEAIEAGGSSLRDYVNSDGEAGFFQNRFLVYGREGDACLTCKTPIRGFVLGQRATFYCPRCQR